MNKIKSDIKNQNFSRIYLLYGEDDFNKRAYSKLLANTLVPKDDSMNHNVFSDEGINEDEVISIAQTLPFFGERRVILIKNSGWFKNSCKLPEYFESFADTTYLVFVENEVDKRSKMYKLVKKEGYVTELNSKDDEKQLLGFVAYNLGNSGVKLTSATAAYFLDKVGYDKNKIINECEKLASYVADREEKIVTEKEIDEICSVTLENRIFEMIDDLANSNKDSAIKKYMDLLSLKEAPPKILKLIIRHYRILYLILSGREGGLNQEQICKIAKIPSFTFRKYNSQISKYNKQQLIDIIERCVECEELFKTGNLSDQMAVDILLCTI